MRAGAPTPVEAKREELERCDDALAGARSRLDSAAERTRGYPADLALDDLQPLSLEIARLRGRRARLAEELTAVEAEWAAT
ncbi:MAG TPA: hypothetical protein VHF89_02910 [Solirubrobacteraceae bacterium]|nr:hypothetical protein [Solirubrobacteraceae bacterium]